MVWRREETCELLRVAVACLTGSNPSPLRLLLLCNVKTFTMSGTSDKFRLSDVARFFCKWLIGVKY